MTTEVSDRFARPNTTTGLGSTEGSTARAWQILRGSWRILNEKPVTTTHPAQNPLAVVSCPESLNRFQLKSFLGAGDALYWRVQDANNWWRFRSHVSSTFVTTGRVEHEWRCQTSGAYGGTPASGFLAGHTHPATLQWVLAISPSPCTTTFHSHDGQVGHWHDVAISTKTGNVRTIQTGGHHEYTRTFHLDLMVNGALSVKSTWPWAHETNTAAIFVQDNRFIISVGGILLGQYVDSANMFSTQNKHGFGGGESGNHYASEMDFVVIDLFNDAPSAPRLLTPANGSHVDFTQAVQFAATFFDPGDSAAAFALRRKVVGAGSYTYFNRTTNAFQSTEVWNTGIPQHTFTSLWSNGTAYQWSMATEDTQQLRGPYANDFIVTGGTAPSVTITSPSVSVTDSTNPLVTATYFSAQGRAMQSYHVKVFRAEQFTAVGFDPATSTAHWDSGSIASSTFTPVQVGSTLLTGQTYRVYAQVVDSTALASSWVFVEFQVQLDAPAPPQLIAVAEPESGRVRLVLTATHDGQAFPDTTFWVRKFQGNEWVDVRGAQGVPIVNDRATVYDWECISDSGTWYIGLTLATFGENLVFSEPTFVFVTLSLTQPWLKYPLDPALNQMIKLADMPEIERGREEGVFYLAGRDTPIVVSGKRRKGRGHCTIEVDNYAERRSIAGLLESNRTLLLQMPSENPGDPGEQWYIEPVTSTKEKRVAAVSVGRRHIEVPFVEVDRPPADEWLGTFPAPATEPPVVLAGGDAITNLEGPFSRTAQATHSTGVIDTWEWKIQSGPDAETIIGTTQTVSWTPTVAGTYTLRVTATTAGLSSFDEFVVIAQPGATGGGGSDVFADAFVDAM